ncbi:MAG TPA: acetylglutamate kinase [Actinomycetota bacterium]|nr:acetylglutamate kinase [Actinomycetota bacterium]
MTIGALEKSRILMESLPYIKRYHGKTIVVKYGGAAMDDASLREGFADDVALMRFVGLNPVVVHGGGPQVTAHIERLGGKAQFVGGYRVTTAEDLEVVRMVLAGVINKDIVTLINRHGSLAAGLSGEDGGLVGVRKKQSPVDLGFVGDVESINPAIVTDLLRDFIPVIATLGVDDKGQTYNVNADEVAAAVAVALGAEKLVFLTNVEGILDAEGELVPQISAEGVGKLREGGVLSAGMLPKIDAALQAIDGGVPRVTILDGRAEHALLLEIFTDQGVGTMVTA